MTSEQDLVLIYFEDQPLTFARIETIEPDVKRGWFLVTLLMLQVPLQTVTWILRDVYINGEEYTMDGKRMRLEKVVCPDSATFPDADESQPEDDNGAGGGDGTGNKVISFTDHKKK